MSTLYIRHPARAHASDGNSTCLFAQVADGGQIEREGSSTLSALSASIAAAKRVILLLAASDVGLWRMKLPPLPANKLKLALPNLLEEQLLCNPQECIILAQPGAADADGMHTVAVVQRQWLESLQAQLRSLGAKQISVLPSQLCLGQGGLALVEHHATHCADLTLIPAHAPGIGLPIFSSAPGALAEEVMRTLRQFLPAPQSLELCVAQAELGTYQSLADSDIQVHSDSWHRWVQGASQCKLDLMAGVAGGSGGKIAWDQWRWPAVLLVLIGLVHIFAINIEWLRAKKEADMVKASLKQAYRNAYPNDPPPIYPLDQMRQKIQAAKLASGQAAPDDFTALSAAFGDAWASTSQNRKVAGIASIEYKAKTLSVKWKEDGELPEKEMESALKARQLQLSVSAPRVWQIKAGK